MRSMNNPNNIRTLIAQLRLRQVDPLGNVADRLSVCIYDQQGNPIENVHYLEVESSLPTGQLETLFAPAETAAEQAAVADYIAATGGFNALPNWATWTAEEAETNLTAAIFNGATAAAVKANIASTLTDITTANVSQINARLAVIRTLLGNAVDAIVAIRGILAALGQAIVYLRNLVVRLR